MQDDQQGAARPIRALLRGLAALEALNEGDGLSVTDVARHVKLPRTTAYRILETLRAGGYVVRDANDELFRPTVRVRRLAGGLPNEPWVAEFATPLLRHLCKDVLWPIMLDMVRGGRLQLRMVTDDISPVVLNPHTAGGESSLTMSAAGVMRLAAASAQERELLLRIARSEGASEDECAFAAAAAQEAERCGYALDLRDMDGEAAVAAPIFDGDKRLRAVVSMRYIKSALKPEAVVADYLPQLQACAVRIGAEIPLNADIGPAIAPDPANDPYERALRAMSGGH